MSQMHNTGETTICRICLEPVTNFICADCLSDGIAKWISRYSTNPGWVGLAMKGKHEEIRRMLSHESNSNFCVSCKNWVDEIACPCCYLYEMHAMLKNIDSKEVAAKFETDFNFDLIFHHGMAQLNLWESMHGRLYSTRQFKPIVIKDKRRSSDLNACESCEVETDELAEHGGQWLCESCRDEEPNVY